MARQQEAVEAARRELVTFIDGGGLGQVRRNALWPTQMFYLTLACLAVGTPAHADGMSAELTSCRGLQATFLAFAYYGAFDHHLGLLHAKAGRHDEARRHLESALEQHTNLGARPWLALTQEGLGHLLVAEGTSDDRRRGEDLRTQARRSGATLGMADPADLLLGP